MSRPLPQVIDASMAADRRDRLEGRVRVSSFTRLDGLLQSSEGEFDVIFALDCHSLKMAGDFNGRSKESQDAVTT